MVAPRRPDLRMDYSVKRNFQLETEAIARVLDEWNFAGDLARRGFETVKDNSWERRTAQVFSFMVDDPEQRKASFPKTDA
jgi:hypothetical protein